MSRHLGVPPLLVGDVIRTAAARTPDRIAAFLGADQRTFAELADASERLARVLASRGVHRGDRVAWWSRTSLDAVPAFFAAAHIGAIFTPLNPDYTDDEAAAVLAQAEPSIVITTDGRAGHVTYDELMDSSEASLGTTLPGEVGEDDIHVIYFTSGTTGQPKGVMLSHRTQRLRGGNGSYPRGAAVVMFPQFHMAGWSFTFDAWLSGDPIVWVDRSDAPNLLEAIDRHRAYRIYCIPAVWQRILDADRRAYDLSCLRIADTGTSATTIELLSAIRDAFPDTTTTIAYGSTEANSVCTLWPEDVLRKPGSVGPPSPGVLCRIDENDELWATNSQLFSGYYRNEEATRDAVVDGWYRTGEIAERDSDGYYYIVGRSKDIIRTGGESVAPVEVDLVIKRHPAVLDAAVAGVPDDRWGEVITAFVVLRDGALLDLEELRRHCEGSLAKHKHPRALSFVEAIPRTGTTGQVQRRHLVDLAQRNLATLNPAKGRLTT